ncbi:MAG: dehydrogenase [Rhodocyclaceae bacterium]|nr:MAG: dehydrogenase [Rhodocyclaceae bacterium]TND05575.1 MAG: dehydrogenase [Rhodocyclaceae bacterium]
MKDGLVRVAVIGCGRVSGHHCRSIAETEGVELVAVCDLAIEKANVYRDQFGARAYDNYHRMLLENPRINTVAIVTPSGMHHEHALDIIARYRKNIIVEKPTFMKPSQVADAYARAAAAGVEVFAVFQNRHNLAVKRVLQGLAQGELGKLRSVAVRVRWCRPQRYYDLAPWRGTFAMDGGCLTNQGIHHIDLLRRLGGEVSRVCSTHRTLGAEIEVEDTATAAIEFESGAIGALEVTTAARPIDYEASLSLVCEKGLAQIGGIAVNELQIYTPDPAACAANSEDFSGNVYGHGHVKIYEEILAHFKGEQKFPVSYEDTLRTIQLLNSFYRADETRGWVDVATAGDSIRLGREDERLADIYRTAIPSAT